MRYGRKFLEGFFPQFIDHFTGLIERNFDKAGRAAVESDSKVAANNNVISLRDEKIAGLSHAIAERDGQIVSLSHAIAERDGQIVGLSHAIAERDGEIAGLSHAIAERDGQIAGLSHAIAERDGQIVNLRHMVAESDRQIYIKEHHIQALLQSHSWRWTKPLRFISVFVRLIHALVRMAIYRNCSKLPISRQIFIRRIRHSPLFDQAFYVLNNPDVGAKGVDPATHYYLSGWKEHRDPSERFSTRLYLSHYLDVAAAGINPLLHYIEHGEAEGRGIFRVEKTSLSLVEKVDENLSQKEALSDSSPSEILGHDDAAHALSAQDTNAVDVNIERIDGEVEDIRRSGCFDVPYYLETYPDIQPDHIDPIRHYCEHGWREGRNPSDSFDTRGYLEGHEEIKDAEINPLWHYVVSGALKLGQSSLDIEITVAILTKNPGPAFRDVLASVLNQNIGKGYEVLVIDSGSSDGTIQFLETQASVRLVQIKPAEFGHGKTRNLAVSLARGKYVAMLTHDAKPFDKRWLANLVEPFEADPMVAGVFGRHVAYDSAQPWTMRDINLHFDHFLQWPLIMGMEDPERYARDQGYRQVLHYFSDNNACLRKSIWEKIPYPDVDFAEDQLWAKSIIEGGYKRAYASEAVVYHSHDYTVVDTLRRSFDESRALKRLFGYHLCPSFAHGLYQTYACSKRDISYVHSLPENGNKLFALSSLAVFVNAAKQLGFFIGAYQGPLKWFLYRLFSLDGSKKRENNELQINTFLRKVQKVVHDEGVSGLYRRIRQKTKSKSIKNAIMELNSMLKKINVIDFYKFVLAKNAYTITAKRFSSKNNTVNWLIPDFGIGSGGHLNIFRFISMLESHGYTNTICIVGDHRHSSEAKARELIVEHFVPLNANVVFGIENLSPAFFSFATSWITAYSLKEFGNTVEKLYFVQDYEPYFYSHSSEYEFAEETYKFGFTGICAGSWLSNKLMKEHGMKCYPVGFSFDRELYVQTPRREPDIRRVFCYCRPPTLRRGLETALLALNIVGERLPDVKFIFAGWDMSGYYFPHEHLNAGVLSLNELPDLYSQCDVGLVLSFTNLSLLPLELMACGCAVVSNSGENTEWLLNDDISVLSGSSPDAIAESIISCLENAEERKKIISQAKQFAHTTDWMAEGDKLHRILQERIRLSNGDRSVLDSEVEMLV